MKVQQKPKTPYPIRCGLCNQKLRWRWVEYGDEWADPPAEWRLPLRCLGCKVKAPEGESISVILED